MYLYAYIFTCETLLKTSLLKLKNLKNLKFNFLLRIQVVTIDLDPTFMLKDPGPKTILKDENWRSF